MARPRTGRPTDGELEILQVLWDRGPSTAAEVKEAIALIRPVGYTTVLTALQTMTEKGLVVADKSKRAHVFRAGEAQSVVVGRMVSDLVQRALGGSTPRLLLYALARRRATPEEREEMHRLIEEAGGPKPEE